MKRYGKNTLVYWDTFGGMIKGKIDDIARVGDELCLSMIVTSRNNKVYPRGYHVSFYLDHPVNKPIWMFPRDLYHKTGLFTYYLSEDYNWIII